MGQHHPHLVEIRLSEPGSTHLLDMMHDQAEVAAGTAGYFTSRRIDRSLDRARCYVRFHFADARAADVFAVLWSGARVSGGRY